MRALFKAALVAILSLGLACGAATAGQVEGVAFDKQATAGPHLLYLRGVGLLRYMVFLKAYVAALYLPETVASAEALADVPKRLEIEYFHAISAPDFAGATTTSIERNVSPTAFRRLKPKIEEFNSLYRDIAPGDRYALSYEPGRGTTLFFNGKALGTVHGDDFAEALFAIWLGSSPLDGNLKERLLGG
jgi:hypothetical protein